MSARIRAALGDAPATLDYRLDAMGKGYALMRAAHLDFDPAFGCARARGPRSDLDRLRGLQWRLVMSVAGFEMFLRGRVGREDKIRKLMETATKLVTVEAPPPPARPRSPSGGFPTSLALLLEIPEPASRSRLAESLGLNKFEEELLLGWFRGSVEPSGWEGHVRLAAALRNVTAHGALSANKVRKLRLRGTFAALPTVLLDFASATLEEPVNFLGTPGH